MHPLWDWGVTACGLGDLMCFQRSFSQHLARRTVMADQSWMISHGRPSHAWQRIAPGPFHHPQRHRSQKYCAPFWSLGTPLSRLHAPTTVISQRATLFLLTEWFPTVRRCGWLSHRLHPRGGQAAAFGIFRHSRPAGIRKSSTLRLAASGGTSAT